MRQEGSPKAGHPPEPLWYWVLGTAGTHAPRQGTVDTQMVLGPLPTTWAGRPPLRAISASILHSSHDTFTSALASLAIKGKNASIFVKGIAPSCPFSQPFSRLSYSTTQQNRDGRGRISTDTLKKRDDFWCPPMGDGENIAGKSRPRSRTESPREPRQLMRGSPSRPPVPDATAVQIVAKHLP